MMRRPKAQRPHRPEGSPPREWPNEEALIGELFAPLSSGLEGAFGLTDDAAFLEPPPGHGFVVSADGIAAGLHLPADAAPEDVAWKALAVNVSDVVAKGGQPHAYLLALMLGAKVDHVWLRRFSQGLAAAGRHFGVSLAGGDTDRLRAGAAIAYAVSVTMLATVPKGRFVTRSGAAPGEKVVLTGPVGAAGLGLALEIDPDRTRDWPLKGCQKEALLQAYRRPRPAVAIAEAIQACATAAIDISDGLLKDADRLRRMSGVGMRIAAGAVPLLPETRAILEHGGVTCQDLLTSGEDYVVLASVPAERVDGFLAAAKAVGVLPSVIGEILEDRDTFVVQDVNGQPLEPSKLGFDHLAGEAG